MLFVVIYSKTGKSEERPGGEWSIKACETHTTPYTHTHLYTYTHTHTHTWAQRKEKAKVKYFLLLFCYFFLEHKLPEGRHFARFFVVTASVVGIQYGMC